MNKARIELSKFYEQQAAREAYQCGHETGYYEGMQFERNGRMDAYAAGWVHAVLVANLILALAWLLSL